MAKKKKKVEIEIKNPKKLDGIPVCPKCGEDNLYKFGEIPDGRVWYQCRLCGRKSLL